MIRKTKTHINTLSQNYLINVILEHCFLKLIYLVSESTMPNSTAPLPKVWI